jgi:hypothetical protein
LPDPTPNNVSSPKEGAASMILWQLISPLCEPIIMTRSEEHIVEILPYDNWFPGKDLRDKRWD